MLKTTCKAHMRPLPAKVFIFREKICQKPTNCSRWGLFKLLNASARHFNAVDGISKQIDKLTGLQISLLTR